VADVLDDPRALAPNEIRIDIEFAEAALADEVLRPVSMRFAGAGWCNRHVVLLGAHPGQPRLGRQVIEGVATTGGLSGYGFRLGTPVNALDAE
jgi:hypothetical protein